MAKLTRLGGRVPGRALQAHVMRRVPIAVSVRPDARGHQRGHQTEHNCALGGPTKPLWNRGFYLTLATRARLGAGRSQVQILSPR